MTEAINTWLASLPRDDRVLFVRRYWHGSTMNELAKETGTESKKLARRMYDLRQRLKSALEKEGYSL